MLKLWPGIFALLFCLLCFLYGKWRRERGSPVKAREAVWIMLLVAPISFAALALPSILGSSAMTPSDRLEALAVTLAIEALPLGVGLCFWGALRLVRLYIDHARSAARDDTR